MDTAAHLLLAADVRVLSESPNGSGVVEIPILTEASAERIDLDGADLDGIVTNARRGWDGPLGVGPSPHRDFGERGGPQEAFIVQETVHRRGAQLWATIEIVDADLFAQIKSGKWRGFSVELIHSTHMPEVLQDQHAFDGWVLVGGIFTNRPATNSTFRIAAEAVDTESVWSPIGAEETKMDEKTQKTVSLDAHEAKVTEIQGALDLETQKAQRLAGQIADKDGAIRELEARVATLESETTLATASKTKLEAQAKRLSAENQVLTTRATELELQVGEQEKATTKGRILDVISAATDPASNDNKASGALPPAIFHGHEADPVAWLEANFASLDAFEQHVDRLRGFSPVKAASTPKSGHDPAAEDDTEARLSVSDDEKDKSRALATGTDFVGVRTEAEARKIHARRLAATNAGD